MSSVTDRVRAVLERLPDRSALTGERINRAVLAVVVTASVVAVAFGAGYRSSRADLGDGGAFLQKDTRVLHVNADNRDADAVVAKELATGKQTLEVVQVRPGVVYVVNNDTGVVTRLPTDTLDPQTVDKRPDSKGKLTVVSGGGSAYLVDSQRGTVSQLDGAAGQQTPVRDAPPVEQAVVDGTGTAWAYAPSTGELVQISGGAVKGRQRVLSTGERASITLVAGAPVLYVPHTGQAALYGPDGVQRLVDLDAAFGVVAAPGAAATVAVVVARTGELVLAEFDDKRDVRRIQLRGRAGHRFGPPVVHRDRVYVPDYTSRHVLVVHNAQGRVEVEQPVPGRSSTFTVFARDNRVWVNDPHDTGVVLTFDSSGRPTTMDVGGAARPTPTGSKKPVPTPSAAPTPGSSTAPPELITLPNLVGADRATVCNRLDRRLRCLLVAQPDGPGETDRVTQTDPVAGSRVRAGRTVTVFYRGPAQVPDLVNLPAAQACRALTEARLACREQASGLAVDGSRVRVVTAQSVPPGSRAATGTPVTITYPDQIAVPNFVGQPYNIACPVGLTCAPRDIGANNPAYVVLAQQPAAGAGAVPGGIVTLDYYSYSGVPDLRGMSSDQACAELAARALVCNRNDNAVVLGPINVVLDQSPPPGGALPAGTAVTITYESTGPVPLHRFKAPGARRANFISPGGGGPGGWSQQSTLGRVYGVGAAVPGLVTIYQSRCDRSCGEAGGYYYSANPAVQPNWVMEGPAFSCFGDAQPGTVTLNALFNPTVAVWVFAHPGAWEYDYFKSNGWTGFEFVICHMWPRP
jgi:beta-lactam-binding protein with PASTA domain